MPIPHRPRRQAGFSLLEVLVAFTILALSLGVLLQIFSRAMTTTAIGEGYDRAAALAELKLRQVGYEIPLEPGVHEGETDDGLAWTIRIVPDWGVEDPFGEAPWTLYRVVVDVLWRDGGAGVRRLTLPTLRLGGPPL